MKMRLSFFSQVCAVVKSIPKGKITTYGIVARLVDTKDSRRIGHALHANRDPNCPCYRVVFKDGSLAPGYAFGGPKEQRFRLEKEGVGFKASGKVDLVNHLWNESLSLAI